jgi:hypothetical protein
MWGQIQSDELCDDCQRKKNKDIVEILVLTLWSARFIYVRNVELCSD